MLFGYARISTKDQKLDLQIDSLQKHGVDPDNIYSDIASGVNQARTGLQSVLLKLRKGDTFVVWKLDRAARSVVHLAKLIESFETNGIHFKSIEEPHLDTTTSHGKFVFTLFSAVAQLERDLIRERTKAGLEAAKARGRVGGRKKGLSAIAQAKARFAEDLYLQNTLSVAEICKAAKIGSKRTLYSYLRHQGVVIGNTSENDNSTNND